jgi:predicted enzyme related to lactoylglutathione lyase
MEIPPPSEFCWNELMTNNVAACKKFYTQLFGWRAEDVPMGPMTYTMFKKGDKSVGGMMALTPDMGPTPPHWMYYVAVENCDAAAKRVAELGGKICVPPTDIPNIGRFAVAMDPSGAAFAFIKLG